MVKLVDLPEEGTFHHGPVEHDGFAVSLGLDRRTLAVRELHIVPLASNADGEITARWLRTLPFGKIVDAFWSEIAMDSAREAARDVQDYAGDDADTRLALTARAYLALVDASHPQPTQVLADALGLSLAGMRTRIVNARQRGILSATEPGKGGGKLTAKGKRLLTKIDIQG